MKLKWLVKNNNSGEVIDKTYWGEGDEILYTCSKNRLSSSFSKFPNWKRTTINDLLLTRNGTPYIHVPPEGAIYSNVVQRIDVSNLNRKYLAYALENRVQTFYGYGVSIQSLNYSMWSNLEINLPEESIQNKIVDFLDTQKAKITSLIIKKEEFIKLLEEKKSALISEAVTRGINPNISFKKTKVGWLNEIPSHWGIEIPNRLFSESKERAHKDDEMLSATQKYGVISTSKFESLENRQVTKAILHLEKRKHVEKGDFVISMRSMDGGLEIAHESGSVRSSYSVLKPSNLIDGKFFSFLLKSNLYIQALQLTTNFVRDGQDMNFNHFKKVPLPKIPLEEQKLIAKFLEDKIKTINTIILKTKDSIDLINEYYFSMLDKILEISLSDSNKNSLENIFNNSFL